VVSSLLGIISCIIVSQYVSSHFVSFECDKKDKHTLLITIEKKKKKNQTFLKICIAFRH